MKKKTNKKKKTQQDSSKAIIAKVAGGLGIGIIAGFVGTAVMTAAQMLEMQLSGRESSDTPYKALKKTFGIEAQTKEDKEFLTNATHFAYGTTWGIPRGLLAAFGAKGSAGTSVHFGSVWGTELVMLPSIDLAKPITEWKPKAIAEDAMFHIIYATAAGVTADALAKWMKKAYRKKS